MLQRSKMFQSPAEEVAVSLEKRRPSREKSLSGSCVCGAAWPLLVSSMLQAEGESERALVRRGRRVGGYANRLVDAMKAIPYRPVSKSGWNLGDKVLAQTGFAFFVQSR